MKTKIFKTKSVIALALALFMIVPMLCVALPSVQASGNPTLSVVKSGTTNVTTIPAGIVGSTFSVDVRVDNIGDVSPGINGLSYSLSYDPTVLNLTSYAAKETSFWGDAQADVTAIITKSSGVFTEAQHYSSLRCTR